MKFEISNKKSGQVLGVYEGSSPQEALDNMAKDAGYRDHEDACDTVGGTADSFLVVEVHTDSSPTKS